MAIKHSEQRVGIFLDVQNLYHAAKNLFGARVNYQVLLRELLGGRKLVRTLGYVVKADIPEALEASRNPPPAQREGKKGATEAAFFDALVTAGVELRMKDISVYAGGVKKADWDVGMAVDAIRMAPSVDAVVLVTGDGDFVPLVEYLKWGLGKQVEVAAFSRSASSKLREAADTFIPLEDVQKVLLKK